MQEEPLARRLASLVPSSSLPRRWQSAATVRRRDPLYGKEPWGPRRRLAGSLAFLRSLAVAGSGQLPRIPGAPGALSCFPGPHWGWKRGRLGRGLPAKRASMKPRASAAAAPGALRGLEPGSEGEGRAGRLARAPDSGRRMGGRQRAPGSSVSPGSPSLPGTSARSPSADPPAPGPRRALEKPARRRRAPAAAAYPAGRALAAVAPSAQQLERRTKRQDSSPASSAAGAAFASPRPPPCSGVYVPLRVS